MKEEQELLKIEHEQLSFFTPSGEIKVLKDVNLQMKEGEVLALVGGSGSGKSVTAYSILGLTADKGRITGGSISFKGRRIDQMSEKELRTIRGKEISLVFQDSMSSLNPLMTVGKQIEESIILHSNKRGKKARERAKELLTLVGINEADRRLKQYPHELSGGMRQRVMIAIALACQPKLLIADEPTSSLDVTIQAQILELMQDLKKKLGMGILLITHDLGLVASMCDSIAVMQQGRIIEYGSTDEIFYHPKEEYTRSLLRSIPKLHEKAPVNREEAKVLEVEHLIHTYPLPGSKKRVHTLNDLSFYIKKGETFGLVGESGCGKSTLGKSLLGLSEPVSGRIRYEGQLLFDGQKNRINMTPYRRKMQVIFQDPFSSLDPRLTVEDIIGESLDIHKLYKTQEERLDKIYTLLQAVGLNKEDANRYPHEFSGGQCQRIGIARTLGVNPQFIVCDEPLSALDVSVRVQIMSLLKKLQKERGLTYLFISHDLTVVNEMADRIGVMYLGHLVEIADSNEIIFNPCHPYTRFLISAIPPADPRKARSSQRFFLEGELPSPINPPPGCPFQSRCPYSSERCLKEKAELKEVATGHFLACHNYSLLN